MAGSIPGSDFAERTAGLSSSASAPARATRWRRLRRLARARLAPFGAAVMLLAVLAALAAPLLAPYDPLAQNLGNTLARPGPAHLLGTDNVGRDVLSRVIWGTRVSLVAGLVSVALAVVAGSLLGILAGYCGGRVDGVVMRLRSEEHTSELQSLAYLVCRLLLEKKKKKKSTHDANTER